MKKKKKFPVLLVIIILVAIAAGVYSYLYGGLSAEVVECQTGSVEDYYSTTGRIVCGDSVDVLSEVSGKVLNILVNENDEVSEGQVIAVIDSTDLNNELKQIRFRIEQATLNRKLGLLNAEQYVSPESTVSVLEKSVSAAKATYEAAQLVFKADEKLYQSKSISSHKYNASKAEYEKASSDYADARTAYQAAVDILANIRNSGIKDNDLAKAFREAANSLLSIDINSARAEESAIIEKLKKYTIRASKSGIVSDLPVKAMNVIYSGSVVAVINPSEKVYAEADVLTNAVPFIKVGEPVVAKIVLKGSNEFYNGTVSEVYDFASEGISSLGLKEYRVHVKVDLENNAVLKDRNGYGTTLKFRIFSDKKALWVPASAVFTEGEQDYVYKVSADRTAEAVPVSAVRKTASQYVVKSGLSAGDVVIKNCKIDGLTNGVKLAK